MANLNINPVRDNMDKEQTYREMCGRYRVAMREEFYFEAILISYAMLEDRLRSLLFYLGVVQNRTDTTLKVKKTKNQLRKLYFGTCEYVTGKTISLRKISVKVELLKRIMTWVEESEGKPDDQYLSILKEECISSLDIGGVQDVLEETDKWRNYRNEVIHGLMNKNLDSLYVDLRENAEKGMNYARFIDSQVKALKKKNAIRKKMKLQGK